MSSSCPSCGAPVNAGAGPGRPAHYCGTACRRSAEHEVRRVNAHIARLEADRDRLLCDHAAMVAGVHLITSEHGRRAVEVALVAVDNRIAHYEARLRLLLGDAAVA